MAKNSIKSSIIDNNRHVYRAKQIRSVYSGQNGCTCGCKGKHYYTSADRVAAGADRGYAVCDSEVSDRMVTRVIRELLEHPAYVGKGDNNFSLMVGERLYIAYFE